MYLPSYPLSVLKGKVLYHMLAEKTRQRTRLGKGGIGRSQSDNARSDLETRRHSPSWHRQRPAAPNQDSGIMAVDDGRECGEFEFSAK